MPTFPHVHPADPVDVLTRVLSEERERIVRMWAKRLRIELQEMDLPGRDVRKPLARLIDELARLLGERGEEALRLWPEAVRSHAVARYDQRFDADDLVRELKALQHVLLQVCARRGVLDLPVSELVTELVGEATAALQGAFARVLRTEEVRFKEAALMESILHHVDIGIMLVEKDGSISYATPAVGKLLGVPERALVGAGPEAMAALLGRLEACHLDHRAFKPTDMPYAQALKQRRPQLVVCMVINRPPRGEQVYVEMTATPIWEEPPHGGQMVGVVQTMTDRTETSQKALELSEAYEELQRLQARLLQRTRAEALGQLASGAAHALNNFLNVIRLRVALLQREFKPEHLEALDHTVDNISELVARLQELAVVRPEEPPSVVEVDRVFREALELVMPELELEGQAVEVEPHLESGATVRADGTLLRELLINLMLASRDRMPKGGEVVLRTEQVGDHVDLRIEDTGPPYREEELAHLFDPLGARSRTPQLSLLLAVGRNQVHRWGGELVAEPSGRDRGGIFRLKLPLAKPEEARVEPEVVPAPGAPSRPTRRVLVVDDDEDNARMLAELLTDEGYEVTAAHSAEEALADWDKERYDAALLDALMPDITGWQLARELRRRSPEVLLAIVTGADVRGQTRATLAVVDAVFHKPIDVDALDEFLSRTEAPRPAGEPAGVQG